MRSIKRRYYVAAASLLAAVTLSQLGAAQIVGGQWETLHQFDGGAALDGLGTSVSAAGDVDGDGTPDLIVGAADADPKGLAGAGSAYVYSGSTGALIWQFDGDAADDGLGGSVSGAGDVDGDGFDDVIVGAPKADPGGLSAAGSAFVYSGMTGAVLWQIDGAVAFDFLGWAVSGAGDVDRDGFDDVIVGAIQAESGRIVNTGSAFVHSGATGAMIWRFDGSAFQDLMGLSVAGAGDVNGDGFADLIVGAMPMFSGGFLLGGSAFVYDGATGALIWRFDGTAGYQVLGASVSSAGDVDRDGFDDLLVGAPGAGFDGMINAGAAHVYSGATGLLLWRFDDAEIGDELGGSVSGVGDADGDGTPDLMAGATGAGGAGSAYVYSGATGTLIRQFDGATAGDAFGASVSGAGDLDGDGRAELIVGAPSADPGGLAEAGSTFVFGLDSIPCEDVETFQARCSPAQTVQVRVKFFDNSHDGESVTVAVDGVESVRTIFNNFASYQVPNAGPGAHTIELVDPPGCFAPLVKQCSASP